MFPGHTRSISSVCLSSRLCPGGPRAKPPRIAVNPCKPRLGMQPEGALADGPRPGIEFAVDPGFEGGPGCRRWRRRRCGAWWRRGRPPRPDRRPTRCAVGSPPHDAGRGTGRGWQARRAGWCRSPQGPAPPQQHKRNATQGAHPATNPSEAERAPDTGHSQRWSAAQGRAAVRGTRRRKREHQAHAGCDPAADQEPEAQGLGAFGVATQRLTLRVSVSGTEDPVQMPRLRRAA
jgi:hypothetical protein